MAGKVQGTESRRLKLLELIGEGAFGKVYRGSWRGLEVAVKMVLFSNQQGGANAPEKRAVMEAAVSSSVVHPNVVATYHYDIKQVRAVAAAEGSIQIEESASPSDWKLYLVQVRPIAGLSRCVHTLSYSHCGLALVHRAPPLLRIGGTCGMGVTFPNSFTGCFDWTHLPAGTLLRIACRCPFRRASA